MTQPRAATSSSITPPSASLRRLRCSAPVSPSVSSAGPRVSPAPPATSQSSDAKAAPTASVEQRRAHNQRGALAPEGSSAGAAASR